MHPSSPPHVTRSSTLKMETVCFFERLARTCSGTPRYKPQPSKDTFTSVWNSYLILKYILEKFNTPKLLSGSILYRIGSGAGYFEHGERPQGSGNGWEWPGRLNDHHLLTNASVWLRAMCVMPELKKWLRWALWWLAPDTYWQVTQTARIDRQNTVARCVHTAARCVHTAAMALPV
jgi:hypothetical protein